MFLIICATAASLLAAVPAASAPTKSQDRATTVAAASSAATTSTEFTTTAPDSSEDADMQARNQRIREHQAKIDRIIEENRRKHERQLKQALTTATTSGIEAPGTAPGKFAAIYAPPQRRETTDTRVKLVMSDSPVSRIVDVLSQQTGAKIFARGITATQSATVVATEVPLHHALDRIVGQKPNWFWQTTEAGAYEIWDDESFRAHLRDVEMLPPPLAHISAKVKVVMSDAPIERVADVLSQQSGKRVVARGATPGSHVTLVATDIPLERALEKIANENNWLVVPADDSGYEIWDRPTYRREVLPKKAQQRVWALPSVSVGIVLQGVHVFLTPDVGSAVADQKYNKIMVTDVPQALKKVEDYLKLVDSQVVEVPNGVPAEAVARSKEAEKNTAGED